MYYFLTQDLESAFKLTCLVKGTVDRTNFNCNCSLYKEYDFDVFLGVVKDAIKNNIEADGKFCNLKSGKVYLAVFYDDDVGQERGLLLFSIEEGSWFSNSKSKSAVEHLQVRFDSSRLSAGISRATAGLLRGLVDAGVVDRAIGGGSTSYQEEVKNAYLKLGFKMSYEFCYEKQSSSACYEKHLDTDKQLEENNE